MIRTYTITHKKHPGNVAILSYQVATTGNRDNDKLIKLEFNHDCTIDYMERIGAYLPTTYDLLKRYSGVTLKETTDVDTSFDAFWSAYKYKVGKKAKVIKLWDQLDHADRLLALAGVRPYDKHLARKRNQDKMYAETYLRSRQWENEYQ